MFDRVWASRLMLVDGGLFPVHSLLVRIYTCIELVADIHLLINFDCWISKISSRACESYDIVLLHQSFSPYCVGRYRPEVLSSQYPFSKIKAYLVRHQLQQRHGR